MEFTEVIKRRKMVRAFTGQPLPPGTAERLLRAANRAPSAGFSQGYSFLVLEGAEQAAPLWEIFYDDAGSAPGVAEADERAEIAALSRAPLVIVPLASKDMYLDRYARPDKGWTDRDESRWPISACGSGFLRNGRRSALSLSAIPIPEPTRCRPRGRVTVRA